MNVAAAPRPIYTAPTVQPVKTELLRFAESALGRAHPAAAATWQRARQRFIPFLAFPPGFAAPRPPARADGGDLDVLDFELTDDDMTRIAALGTGASLFFDHRDSAMVTRLNGRHVD
jgi:hypothetical protein